jgi:hypothetical protein
MCAHGPAHCPLPLGCPSEPPPSLHSDMQGAGTATYQRYTGSTWSHTTLSPLPMHCLPWRTSSGHSTHWTPGTPSQVQPGTHECQEPESGRHAQGHTRAHAQSGSWRHAIHTGSHRRDTDTQEHTGEDTATRPHHSQVWQTHAHTAQGTEKAHQDAHVHASEDMQKCHPQKQTYRDKKTQTVTGEGEAVTHTHTCRSTRSPSPFAGETITPWPAG